MNDLASLSDPVSSMRNFDWLSKKKSLNFICLTAQFKFHNTHAVGRNANKFQNFTSVNHKLYFLSLCLFINRHPCILHHRNKVLENFRKFISQERHIRISIRSAYWQKYIFSIQTYCLNVNKVHYQNMLSTKIVITNLGKLSLLFS